MANPSIKNGYFPIANELAEQFAKVNITGQEWRILWVLLRKTWGYIDGERRKDWDWISISQFQELTGMKRSNTHKTLKALLAKRLILKKNDKYGFNQDYNQWVLVKRLTVEKVLAKRLTGVSQKTNKSVSQKTNKSVSQLTTHKRKKEKKENNTKERESLPQFLTNILDDDLKELTTTFNCSKTQIKNKGEDLFNYCKAKGKVYKDYKALLRNALSKDFGRRQETTL